MVLARGARSVIMVPDVHAYEGVRTEALRTYICRGHGNGGAYICMYVCDGNGTIAANTVNPEYMGDPTIDITGLTHGEG